MIDNKSVDPLETAPNHQSRDNQKDRQLQKPKLATLFIEFLSIATLTLGGGAVMLPLMEDAFVRKHAYLSEEEMVDIFAMINSMPGVIAVNAASLIGYKILGVSGALVALLGVTVVPVAVIIMLAVTIAQLDSFSWVQSGFRGVRAAVTGLIGTVLLRMGVKILVSWVDICIAVAAFLLITVFQVHGLIIILGAALAGLALHSIKKTGE